MAEVDAKCPVPMVHNLACDEQVQLNCLDVGVEVSPAKHFLKFSCFDNWSPFGPGAGLLEVSGVSEPIPEVLLRVWFRCVVS